jgi:hypothetical protein
LAREYHWLPWQTDDMDWADILRYIEKARTREEQRQYDKINDYMALLEIVHTTKPNRVLQQYRSMLKNNEKTVDDNIGDIQKLKQLKSSRGRVVNGN